MKVSFSSIFNNSKFSFVMFVITFLIAVLCLLSKGISFSDRLIMMLFTVIPCIGYLIIIILSNKFAFKKYSMVIIKVISIIYTFLVLVYYLVLCFCFTLLELDDPIKDVKYYKDYINGDYLLSIFPKEIPNDVEDVLLIYSPNVLQSGEVTSLYYVDSNFDIKYYDNKYLESAKWVGYKNEYMDNKGLFGRIATYMPIEYSEEDEFKIYLMDEDCDDSGYCNHGKFLLVAVNEDEGQVLYTFQRW